MNESSEQKEKQRVHTVSKTWQEQLHRGVEGYLQTAAPAGQISPEHVLSTPGRVVRAWEEYMQGVDQDPVKALGTTFRDGKYDQMIHVKSVRLASMCAHHLCPIVGKVHFAYIPDGHVVGLSKIARMIRILARRPQVQEQLTKQIVTTFNNTLHPKGCGVYIRAYHFCMMYRGVNEPFSLTETTALKGVFRKDLAARQEFLAAVDRTEVVFP